MRAADPARSRVVLVGTPEYAHAELTDIPQIRANLADLARVLAAPRLGGLPAAHVVVAPEQAGVPEIGGLLGRAAAAAEDLLLFYFAGHGLLDRSGELHLALHRSTPADPGYDALRFATVQGTFLGSRAENKVVIIDSCYSGRAVGAMSGDQVQAGLDQLRIGGTFILAAAPANRPALVRDGERHTAFTGRLLHLLEHGADYAGELLTLGEIYRRLYARLRADGLPLPQKRDIATADLLGLVRNAWTPPEALADLPQELQLMLASASARVRQAAVAELGDWLAAADPDRVRTARRALRQVVGRAAPGEAGAAADLLYRPGRPRRSAAAAAALDRFERTPAVVAGSWDQRQRSAELTRVAKALVRFDSGLRAERMVAMIVDSALRPGALAGVAAALSGVDRGRAERIADRAVLAAQGIPSRLAEVAGELAPGFPDRAEQIACGLKDSTVRRRALIAVARAFCATDPARAGRIASAFAAGPEQLNAVRSIAYAMAARDPGRAERLLPLFTDRGAWVLLAEVIVEGWLTIDPDQAERLAANVPNEFLQQSARLAVAEAVWQADPARAEQNLLAAQLAADGDAFELARVAVTLARIGSPRAAQLADRAEQLLPAAGADQPSRDARGGGGLGAALVFAPVFPDRAERLAAGLTPADRTRVLKAIAERCADADPDRAERIIATFGVPADQVRMPAEIASRLAAEDPDLAERFVLRAEAVAGPMPRDLAELRALTGLVLARLALAAL